MMLRALKYKINCFSGLLMTVLMFTGEKNYSLCSQTSANFWSLSYKQLYVNNGWLLKGIKPYIKIWGDPTSTPILSWLPARWVLWELKTETEHTLIFSLFITQWEVCVTCHEHPQPWWKSHFKTFRKPYGTFVLMDVVPGFSCGSVCSTLTLDSPASVLLSCFSPDTPPPLNTPSFSPLQCLFPPAHNSSSASLICLLSCPFLFHPRSFMLLYSGTGRVCGWSRSVFCCSAYQCAAAAWDRLVLVACGVI